MFARMMPGMSEAGIDPSTMMIEVTYLKPHGTASSLRLKRKGGAGVRSYGPGVGLAPSCMPLLTEVASFWTPFAQVQLVIIPPLRLCLARCLMCTAGSKSREAPVKRDRRRSRPCSGLRTGSRRMSL